MLKYLSLCTTGGQVFAEIPVHPGPSGRPSLRAVLSLKNAGDMRVSLKHSSVRPLRCPSMDTAAHGGRSEHDINAVAGHPYQRLQFFSFLMIEETSVYSCRQVHSRRVLHIEGNNPEEYFPVQADGLITGRRDAVLTVTVADCLPLFIVDKKKGAYGILHSGWRGTGIILRAIDSLRKEFNSLCGDLQVVIGPGIGACCYEVEKERYEQFVLEFGRKSAHLRDGGYYLDLKEANIRLLHEAGVEDITFIRDCTCCNPGLSSFRRDGPKAHTHMLALIGSIPALRCNR